jgi:hypothetical protein
VISQNTFLRVLSINFYAQHTPKMNVVRCGKNVEDLSWMRNDDVVRNLRACGVGWLELEGCDDDGARKSGKKVGGVINDSGCCCKLATGFAKMVPYSAQEQFPASNFAENSE